MQTMSAPCAKAEILWDLRLQPGRRRRALHSSIHWGKVGACRERLQCFITPICKGQIIKELALSEQETVSLGARRGGSQGREKGKIKQLPHRGKRKERPAKLTPIHCVQTLLLAL